jgi:hypothetical protein
MGLYEDTASLNDLSADCLSGCALVTLCQLSGQPEAAVRYTMKRAASRQPADLANARKTSG